MDFFCYFKDKWYVMQPSSQEAVDAVFDPVSIIHEDGEVILDEDEN